MILALGRHLAESTVFALVVAILCVCMRRRGAATRYALWLIAAAKFALPLALFSWLGEMLRGLLPAGGISAAFPAVVSRWVFSPGISTPTGASTSSSLYSLVPSCLVGIWAAGSAVAFAAWLRKLRVSWSSSEFRGDVEQTFLRLKKRIGLRTDVQLRLTDTIAEPALTGFWKPVVLVPEGLAGQLSAEELEAVILHELAHAKRRDNWTAAFAHAVSCVFWFYPLLWWIEKRLRIEREVACDEMVMCSGAAAEDYVGGILKACRFSVSGEVAGVSEVCGSSLKDRMEAIMSLSSEGGSRGVPRIWVASLAAAIVIVPLAAGLLMTSARTSYAASQSNPQRVAKQEEPQRPITCVSASTDYPEGSVIQEGDGPQQMCVRVVVPRDPKNLDAGLEFIPSWVVTSDVARQRSATVIHLSEPPPVYCSAEPPSGSGLCTCEGGGTFSSGARVNSAQGLFQLRCDHGKWMQTKTPNVVRK